MTENLDHIELEVCERSFLVPRSRPLARRLEDALGPLYPFAQRLEAGAVTLREVALLYGLLLRDEPDQPLQTDIEKWSYNRGVLGHEALSVFMVGLIMGSDRLARSAEALANRGRTAI
jgi:hypothetical protein